MRNKNASFDVVVCSYMSYE